MQISEAYIWVDSPYKPKLGVVKIIRSAVRTVD